MAETLTSSQLRHWALLCASQAENLNVSGADRDRLMKMHSGLCQLADIQEWLDGNSGGNHRATNGSGALAQPSAPEHGGKEGAG